VGMTKASGRSRGLRWLDRFFEPQPQYALVILRITLGGVVFLAYLGRFGSVQALFGPEGMGGASLHSRVPGIAAGRGLEAPMQWLQLVEFPELTWALYGLLLVASLAFASGTFTRTSGTVTLVLHTLFHARNFTASGGWALIIKPLLLFTILAPAGRFASVDAVRRRISTSPQPGGNPDAPDWMGPGWPIRLLQMQICAMYATNWLRLDDTGWLTGRVLMLPLSDRWFGRFDVDWFTLASPLEWLAYAALTLELLAPIALWIRGIAAPWALGLIALHASLELLTNIGWWQPVMIASLTLFLPAAWMARGVGLVSPRASR
jgi:hypothetical protein